jgi:hypothetical protein
MTLAYPTATEDVTFFWNTGSITIAAINDVVKGTSPSVTYNIKFASARNSSTPTSVFSADRTTTSLTGAGTATFANATIAANNWVWLTTSAAAAGTTEFAITLRI